MDILTASEVINLIQKKSCFEAELDDHSLYIKISDYVPYICTAIHNGSNFRNNLKNICNLSANERYHEEDAYTGNMIQFAPVCLIANDSRYEYDLNRNPSDAIHQNAWGKTVWKRKLTEDEKKESLNKHSKFYDIFTALVEALIMSAPFCIIFDIHSYNILDRKYVNPPLFNIGTHFVNKEKFQFVVDYWIKYLKKINISNVCVDVKENDVFFGKGYLAEIISATYPNCLVLPTEVKKIYASESEPNPNYKIIQSIEYGFKQSIDSLCNDLF